MSCGSTRGAGLDRCLAPLSRALLLLSILLVAMAVLMAVMDAPVMAVVLVVLAVSFRLIPVEWDAHRPEHSPTGAKKHPAG